MVKGVKGGCVVKVEMVKHLRPSRWGCPLHLPVEDDHVVKGEKGKIFPPFAMWLPFTFTCTKQDGPTDWTGFNASLLDTQP